MRPLGFLWFTIEIQVLEQRIQVLEQRIQVLEQRMQVIKLCANGAHENSLAATWNSKTQLVLS